MNQSEVMIELRKIRDLNSERHLKMTDEERRKEANDAIAWLYSVLYKTVVNNNQTHLT